MPDERAAASSSSAWVTIESEDDVQIMLLHLCRGQTRVRNDLQIPLLPTQLGPIPDQNASSRIC